MQTTYSLYTWRWIYGLIWLITLAMITVLGFVSHWNGSLMVPVLISLIWLGFISKTTAALVRKVDARPEVGSDSGLAKLRINLVFISAFLLTMQFVFLLITMVRPGGFLGSHVNPASTFSKGETESPSQTARLLQDAR